MHIAELIGSETVDARFLTNKELKMLGWSDKPNTIGIVIGDFILVPVVYGEEDNVPISDNIPAFYEFDFNEEIIYPISIGYLSEGGAGPTPGASGASGATAMP